jgi:nucleoid-associated protein YgaU
MGPNAPDPSRQEKHPGQERAKAPTASNMPPSGGLSSATPSFPGAQTGASSTATRIYEVQAGDTLERIAEREYGKAERWPAILEANRDVLKKPEDIEPGLKLKLPTQ